MIFGKQSRTYFLAFSFFGVILVLLKTLVAPIKEQQTLKSPVFPSAVPLSGWQLQSSKNLTDKIGRVYQYNHQQHNLRIEINYVVGYLENELPFRQYNPQTVDSNKPTYIIRQLDKMGAYALSINQNRAYLHSCINPNGLSAITYEQFIYNRHTSDLKLHRLLPVLLNQQPLRDSRCFWTHLSIPIQPDNSHENSYQILENAWMAWYEYWHSRFP
ncbi:cyanoexosortase A system-associated protein [Nostoc sp. TCL26-01]|uniref:cyanoexosortase A system-associated protein n=1 Tax=Nostoc sp. TCL26-01 TaxID=2576904 RepID=UPI0015B9DC6F|nr:cyanoexosortase A system-associated protein [Nostoc sp. TCL26-01]QLE58193.1 cyanoexosortase A system-associated protein [Nostoc sp. TCL26-01]